MSLVHPPKLGSVGLVVACHSIWTGWGHDSVTTCIEVTVKAYGLAGVIATRGLGIARPGLFEAQINLNKNKNN